MLNPTVSQLKSDIASKMKGTQLNQIRDFYGTAAAAANRMLNRIDLQETIRIATLSTPFFDNVYDYVLMTDYGGMIDLRPQANRFQQPGLSIYSETTPRQFLTRYNPNSFSIRFNNGVRTLRAQALPMGDCTVLDPLSGATSNGLWVASADASGLYTEYLNYIAGNSSLGLNLSGVTGVGTITDSTVPQAVDLSAYRNEDYSFLFVWIPIGFSARFTSFALSRGDNAAAFRTVTATTKADGTAFNDGWNFLSFPWINGIDTGTPTNLSNQYRVFTMNYAAGTAIPNILVNNWTNSFGQLYEAEYYSECLFRDATTGAFKYVPDDDSDLINVGTGSYEILKAEMMIDVTQIIRTGAVMQEQLTDWRQMLNGQPLSRYVKDPADQGLYANYQLKFPSTRIVTTTKNYTFDV